MKSYTLILKVTPWDKDSKPYTTTTEISCRSASEAIDMATDGEGGNWDWKRSTKEVIALVKVSE